MISYATKTDNKLATTTITDLDTLGYAFWSLCAVSLFLYAVPRAIGGRWENLDWLRLFIPALAFIGWTMLQTTSAFDAVSSITQPRRALYAIILALVLGAVATALAYKVDQKQPG